MEIFYKIKILVVKVHETGLFSVPLLHVLANHARTLDHVPAWRTWLQLTGTKVADTKLSLMDQSRTVPLLLRDPLALLIQFVLILPLNMDQSEYANITRVI